MDEQKPNNEPIGPVKPEHETQSQPNPEPIYAGQPSMQTSQPTGPSYTPVSVPTNSLAIVSLVSSILSWVFLPFVGGIIGLVTGIMARKEIKQANGAQGGDGMATVGVIVSAINIVFCCLAVVCVSALIFVGVASEGFPR